MRKLIGQIAETTEYYYNGVSHSMEPVELNEQKIMKLILDDQASTYNPLATVMDQRSEFIVSLEHRKNIREMDRMFRFGAGDKARLALEHKTSDYALNVLYLLVNYDGKFIGFKTKRYYGHID